MIKIRVAGGEKMSERGHIQESVQDPDEIAVK